MAWITSSVECATWAAARGSEAVRLHSSDNNERLGALKTNTSPCDGPGLLLQLEVGCACFDWISSRTAWTARFRLQVVHEASCIELIHWFDTFQEAPLNVGTRPTEIQTRQVPFAGIVRWDVNGHVLTSEGVATPPQRPGKRA